MSSFSSAEYLKTNVNGDEISGDVKFDKRVCAPDNLHQFIFTVPK